MSILLRFLIHRSPMILVGIGIAVAAMLGWFSSQYLYPSISQTGGIGALEPSAPIEFIDAHRIEQLDHFFRSTDTLPPIDPASVRDVLSAPGAAPSSQSPATSRPSR